ncbi:hypothetical protein [Sorangium cellulosum]|uniref:Uncharacterized protein n=1 Tax=Sorangium cellulosum TaxID=56 RepID=A0A150PZW2_SORCE|nr:hypothetical protein [Sorangium cellulosum]KYF61220.1 hypothetical protein BE15_07060 [Sorangium cellulosum]
MIRARVAAAGLLLAAGAGCEPSRHPPVDPVEAGASPNARILPAPLASETPDLLDASTAEVSAKLVSDDYGRLVMSEASQHSPLPLAPAAPLPEDTLAPRELPGVALEAAFRWRDVPQPPKAPQLAAAGLQAAQAVTDLTWKIELAETGRMRVQFTSRALPLPSGSELRARHDVHGEVLLWPGLTQYRVLPPGALRTLLGERRIDVTPLSTGSARPIGEGKRLDVDVRKVEMHASLGALYLELGRIPEAGEGGPLLCRALLEILGVDPKSPECVAGEVPLHASYAWQGGGGVGFEVTSVARRTDLVSTDMLMPPPSAAYAAAGLPSAQGGVFLSRDELAAIRTEPLPLPASVDPGAPGEGFVAVNQTDALLYLLVDGIPAVAVPPMSERYVSGPQRGLYVVQWRTFLGESIEPPQTVEMPARLVRSAADGDAADGG